MADELINHFDVSASALTAERTRMRLIASNIANVNSTRTEEGGPYKRQFATLQTQPLAESNVEKGVRVERIVTDPTAPRVVFEPEHPDADKEGYVAYPNVNLLKEVTDMKSATMAYQANISVIESQKKIIQRAMDIGR